MAHNFEDLLAAEKPEVVAAAREQADKILLDIHLAELRQKMEITQGQIAAAMGVKQPTVVGLERKGRDLKLSSLKRYVEALGGRVRLDVELPDGSHHGFSV